MERQRGSIPAQARREHDETNAVVRRFPDAAKDLESVEIGKATVAFDPATIDTARIEAAVTEEGYPARAVAG